MSPLLALLIYVILTLLAFLFIAPVLFMVMGSFKPDALVLTEANSLRALFPSAVSLENFYDVFARVNFLRFLLNSLFITGSIVLFGLGLNSMAGYALARLDWQGRRLAFLFVIALMIVPLEAIAVPLFFQMTVMGWRDSYQVQIIPFIANAFSIYLFYTFFLSIPRELEEAARMDGASPWKIFLKIAVPLSLPVFATAGILTFLTQWGSYLWPLMVTVGETYRPLPVAIATFQTLPPLQWGDIMAFGVMMVAPILIIFLVFQNWFVKSVASTGIK